MRSTPALRSLCHLVLGFLIASTSVLASSTLFSVHVKPYPFALLVGIVSALLSWFSKQERWWALFQLLFPLSIVIALTWAISPLWYLGSFIASLSLYGATYRTQVPYYPSDSAVWSMLPGFVENHAQTIRVIDIGCGLGGCAVYLKKQFPRWSVEGIELALLPWLACTLRTCFSPNHPTWLFGDYTKLNFGQYGLIFAYLSPAAMASVERKLLQEWKEDTVFVSLSFALPTLVPFHCKTVDGKNLYAYRATIATKPLNDKPSLSS